MHWCARGREAARWVGNCAVSLLRRLAPPPPLSPQPPPHKRLLSDAHAAPIRGAGAICSFWLGSFRWVCPLCWPRPRTCWTPAPCVSPACRPATCCRRRAPWRARAGVGCFAVWRSSEDNAKMLSGNDARERGVSTTWDPGGGPGQVQRLLIRVRGVKLV